MDGHVTYEHLSPPRAGRAGSKSSRVYEELRAAIVALRLPPGAQIDKTEICARLGVSRQPLSEALSRLAEERLVTVEPQKGTYVTRIRMRDVTEAHFVREALEVATVRRIAPDIDDEALDYALRYARGIEDDRARADRFVGMYVNEWTRDYSAAGRAAVQGLLDRGHAAGLLPARVEAEFVTA